MNMMEKAVKALRRITASRNRGAKEKIKIKFLVLFPAWEKNIPTLNRSRDSDLLRTSPRDIKHNKLVEVRNRTKQALAWVRLLHLLQKKQDTRDAETALSNAFCIPRPETYVQGP